ncbi:hypothetical protein Ddye_009103 [Dipteronia dyeriana]|uniref:Reverse transcriptase zinc-binding domain-containing protein n=1 Tax=Dipteronia dyeriana TaxID=168575 RepID=A0AAE0CLZ6_9ROSI|nr:hypothetical protein Ddye_009103 [Dipteronia dyeriana]
MGCWQSGFEGLGVRNLHYEKKVLCAKYEVDRCVIKWNRQCKATISPFVRTVSNLFKSSSISMSLLKEGFHIVLGCGDKIDFWNDITVEANTLKVSFPIMFALTCEKNEEVRKFGFWSGLYWEKEQWYNFLNVLLGIKLRSSITDAIAWKFCSNGLFSVGSLRKKSEDFEEDVQGLSRFVWQDVWIGGVFPVVRIGLSRSGGRVG